MVVLQKDKLLHFFCGFFIYAIANIFLAEIYALLIVLIVAVCKELYDKYIKKTFIDYLDIGFTIFSGVILTIF
ncbi:hypothetical protein ACFQ5N_02140 [Lutibacter holmesii]|uniref:Uncharacterized protein n=1 Tax=Lutibacter holmesii TaxID=1137985 RepID=A0ABW3WK94_9FLAO